jgi:predicted ATPase
VGIVSADPLLRAVRLDRDEIPDPSAFPFTLPAIRALDRLELHPEVTFLVGENGSGKSTLVEAIAAKLDLDAEGGDRDLRFEERAADTLLHVALRLERGPRRPSMRFYPDGLFTLDEPEAALSPTGLLGLLRRVRELALEGAQFLIATHSPILLAYPSATIYEIGERGLVPTAYADTEHYRVTRAFLEDPGAFLRHLFSAD